MVADLYQISAFEALRVGAYDGTAPISSLRRVADFGLGTYNGLNGEMVFLDGRFYRIGAFGDADRPATDTKTPFAFGVRFHAERSYRIDRPLTSAGLQKMLDHDYPGGILAIRVTGRFRNLTARSFPAQVRPYRPFGSILDQQAMLPYGEASGDFVGFRMPKSVAEGNLNVPGYHFHFVATDRRHGGHVLRYELESGTVQVMRVGKIVPLGRRS